jgi:uncharacterized protein
MATCVAFDIRRRSGDGSPPLENGILCLEDQTEYTVELHQGISPSMQTKVSLFFKPVSDRVGILNFQNFVGFATFMGQTIQVRNRKISRTQFDAMLTDISGSVAELPFAYNSPTAGSFERLAERKKEILYHDFVYLRELILGRRDGENLASLFYLISNNPHRRFEQQFSFQPVERVPSLTPASLMQAVADQRHLAKCPAGSVVRNTALAQRLMQHGTGERFFPSKIYAGRAVSTLDTPENRFVKYFLTGARLIITRFLEELETEGSLLSDEARQTSSYMIEQLDSVLIHPLMQSVGDLTCLPLSSSVLNKRAGYRQIYEHFCRLNMAVHFPLGAEDLERIIDLKDVATLYECWTFFQVARCLSKCLGKPSRAAAADFSAKTVNLKYRAFLEWSGDERIRLFYNKTYSGNRPRSGSYSLPLRPDIALEIGNDKHLFDAKFKLHQLTDFMSDDPAKLDEEEAEEQQSATFKKGDLYKMHTYRDAIVGAKSVWILYPGSESAFYSTFSGKTDQLMTPDIEGVGAISLVPDGGTGELTAILRALLGRTRTIGDYASHGQ